jgi:dTDP-4-amino-4,6-dideoxygalactose transaminase
MSTTSVPLVDLRAQYRSIKSDVDAAIKRVIDNTAFIMGREVQAFEEAFAETAGAKNCVGVASGTAALMLALRACEIGPGDEVILPSHTFVATAEAVCHVGATPVFADIEEGGFNLDATAVEAAVTPRTKAVIPVHLYGHPADMGALGELAERKGLWLIEDAAQAHAAEYDGKRCGSIGHLACFSFYPGKNLGAFGDAGAITGNDPSLIDRARRLRDHGRTTKYLHEEIGYGERMDALQAAILAAKLPHLERWTDARNAHAAAYRQRLSGGAFLLPSQRHNVRHAYHLFVIRTQQRDTVLQELKARGIGAGIHYPIPLHKQPAFAEFSGAQTPLPRTEAAADEVLSLPLFPELTASQLGAVVSALEDVVVTC